MKLTKSELLEQVKNYINDDTSDKAIELIENIDDSFQEDVVSKSEYEKLDKEWREKYINRFNSGKEIIDDITTDIKKDEQSFTYEDLFMKRVGE